MSLLNRGRLRKLLRLWRRPGALVNYAGTRAAYRLKRLTVPSLPTHLDIEPINACNLRCAHCQVTHSEKETVRLPKSAFGSLLDELGGLASVKLQGMGEPFLNDELVPMLKQGEARGVSMRVVSNGTLCHGETIDGLLELSDTEVTFSLDGASAEVFEAIRPGANFDGVCANIRALVQRRGERRQPLIGVAAVMTRRNAHEVVEIVTLAGRLGVDGIVLRPTLGNWGKESMKPHTDPIRLRWSEAAPILEQARAFANERGIDLAVYRPEWLWAKAVCPWPWTSAFIAANGDVVPCCRVSDPDTVCMGNVFEESFARIWNSREYQSLRDRLRNHDPPGFCINCQAAGREDESDLACEPGPTGEPPQ